MRLDMKQVKGFICSLEPDNCRSEEPNYIRLLTSKGGLLDFDPSYVEKIRSKADVKTLFNLDHAPILPVGYDFINNWLVFFKSKKEEIIKLCPPFIITAIITTIDGSPPFFVVRDIKGKEAVMNTKISYKKRFVKGMCNFLTQTFTSSDITLLQNYVYEYFHLNEKHFIKMYQEDF
jgi:hypothetical protein